jgi:uncharacterized protein
MVIGWTYRCRNFAENFTDMRLFITTAIVGMAAILLISGGTLVQKINLKLYHNAFIDNLAKYQIFALIVGIVTASSFLLINPQSKQFLSIGALTTIAEKEKWLGINGKSSWFNNGLQLLLFISIATGIFMFLGVKYTNSLHNFQWWFIPFVLLFSLTNSFAEEMIFRFGIISGLDNYYSKFTILFTSAILFGVPHYFGNPSGIIGVIMSGLLGYILCKATVETKGISIAWLIHFVQDVIIFTAIMMMSIKK